MSSDNIQFPTIREARALMALKSGERRHSATSYQDLAEMMRPTDPDTWSRSATRNLIHFLRQKGHPIQSIRGYGFAMGRASRRRPPHVDPGSAGLGNQREPAPEDKS